MKKVIMLYALLTVSAVVYVLLGYHTLRTEFLQLILLHTLAFLAYGIIVKYYDEERTQIIVVSVLFRVILLFSIPVLSDDFYRFFWDGTLFSNGLNPYLQNPEQIINNRALIPGISEDLFSKLNSPGYFTVYPPICQYVFWIACTICPNDITGSVLVMKSIVLLAEIGSIFLIIKLLKNFKLPSGNVLLYALNPLVIVELSGNLHFEAIMIFFLLLTVYLLTKARLVGAAVAMATAISVKILPLLVLPYLFKRLGFRKFIVFLASTGVVLGILFYPFIELQMFVNLWQSIDLYFQSFEFNASIYYLARSAGYMVLGYNVISYSGPVLAALAMCIIIYSALRKGGADKVWLPLAMMFTFTVFLLFTTTVHPWYITTLVAFSLFTKYRYGIVWSLMVILSYFAYKSEIYQESYLLIWVEYTVVFAWLIFEYRRIEYRKDAVNQVELRQIQND